MSVFVGIGDIIRSIFGRRPAPVPPPVNPPPAPPVGPPAPPVAPIDAASAPALARAINAARAAHGQPMLATDPNLSAVAAAWAARIAASGVLGHGDFSARIATVAPGKASGETVGLGFPDAAAEVQGWLNDGPHRLILLGHYDTLGVGVGVGRDGRFVYVADFAMIG